MLEKAEEFEEKAEETAKDLRVPVPQTRLPFVGPVGSLALKQVCQHESSLVCQDWMILVCVDRFFTHQARKVES